MLIFTLQYPKLSQWHEFYKKSYQHLHPKPQKNEKILHNELLSQLRRRFCHSEANFSLAAATLLDPRFKKIDFANEANFEQLQRRLTSEISSMQSMDIQEEPAGSQPEPDQVEQSESTPSDTTSETSLWSWFEKKGI